MRLPSVLADYACRRSLVCCRPPWRVYLGPQEDLVLAGRLRAARALDVATRLARAVERPTRDVTLIAQRDDGCTLLDPPRDAPGGCALQSAAGLGALPVTCRNFPRSVVRTPRGAEVAFLLQCPSVVDLLVAAPARVAFVDRDAGAWPYDARRAIRDPLWWSDDRGLPFDALEALREGWWRRLGTCQQAPDTAAALDALRLSPHDPDAEGSPRPVGARLGADDVRTELAFLHRLDARGPAYARDEGVAEALADDASHTELAAALGPFAAAFACAAAVTLQFAGVHSAQPVADGLRGAAWQIRLALDLAARLSRVAWLAPGDATRDALTVAAHLARWAAHAERAHA